MDVALLHDKQLYVTSEQKFYHITEEIANEVVELESTHEEEDTRLLLHAAQSGFKEVVITTEDTDIFLHCQAVSSDTQAQLYHRYKTNTGTRTCFTDTGKVGTAYGTELSKAIHEFHAFTGYDTVSSFAGTGKIAALKLLQKDKTWKIVGTHSNIVPSNGNFPVCIVWMKKW